MKLNRNLAPRMVVFVIVLAAAITLAAMIILAAVINPAAATSPHEQAGFWPGGHPPFKPEADLEYDWLSPDYLYRDRPFPGMGPWRWPGTAWYPSYRSYQYQFVYPIYPWPEHRLQDPYKFITSNTGFVYFDGRPVAILGSTWW